MDSSNMLKMPVFSMGTQTNLEKELGAGGHFADLSTIMYAYVKDKGMLAFVHPSDKKLNLIVGNNKKLVENLEQLPSVLDGDEDVLYIVGDIVYTFNGREYVPTYQNVTDRINDIIDVLDTKADKATTLDGYGIQNAYTKTEVNASLAELQDAMEIYTDNALTIKRY